jgi:hypothetical protein
MCQAWACFIGLWKKENELFLRIKGLMEIILVKGRHSDLFLLLIFLALF